MIQIGWFSTGRDEEARKLLDEAIKKREFLGINIAFLFCNREYGEFAITDSFLEYAHSIGLKIITLSSRKFMPELRKTNREEWREKYHKAVWDKISNYVSEYKVEFSFLAGYMLIVGESLIEKHLMLNLHPALPGGPKGSWQDVIWELIEKRASFTGAQIHIVTSELDAGPAVSFCKFSLKTPEYNILWNKLEKDLEEMTLYQIKSRYSEDYPLFKKIRENEFKREIPLILFTLKKITQEGLSIRNIDLSNEVDEYIKTYSL